MYANFGKSDNPQAGILSATARKTSSYLVHTLPSARERQAFRFEVKVHFVKKSDDADLDLVVPERPGLPIYVPRDVFYPLELFGAGNRRSAGLGMLGMFPFLLGFMGMLKLKA